MWSVVRELFSLLAALTPAAFAAWDGRRLLRRLDDPAFPELKLAAGGRLVAVAAGAVVASVLISAAFAVLKSLLLVFATMAAAFPLRRAMFRERWSFWRYAAFAVRFWVGMLGTWILLALLPTALHTAGPYGPAAAAALGSILLAWSLWYRQVFVWMVGARPLHDGAHRAGFESVLRQAAGVRPAIWVAGARGGHWVNAFAVPSLSRPAVVLTRDLLRLLDVREATAIFAHEIAHLEHHTRRRVTLRLALLGVVVPVVLGLFLVARQNASLAAGITWMWPLLCLLVLLALLGRSQAHERESDLRALELSGDPEALIAALTKIHHAMRLPRRWARRSERHQTHPSLAGRIRAIREAAEVRGLAVASAPVATAVLRAADEPTTAVVFGEDRMHWLREVPADVPLHPNALISAAADQRSIRYNELADLRLEVDGMERRFLTATDRDGTRIRVAIRPDDVATVKRNVERIDLEVGETAVAGTPDAGRGSGRGARIVALVGLLLGLLPPFSLPLLASMAMVLVRPVRTALAAACAAAFAVALVGLRDTVGPWGTGLPPVIHALLGLLLLIEARRARRDDGRLSPKVVAAFAAAGALSLIAAGPHLSSPLPWTQLHTWARYEDGVLVALVGIATLAWTKPRPRARLLAAAATAAAVLVGVLGSTWFRDRFADDHLAVTQARLALAPLPADLVRASHVSGYVDAVRASPAGHWAAREASPDPSTPTRFHVDRPGGATATVAAWDAAFLDDLRLAAIEPDGGAAVLRLRRLDTDLSVAMEVRLPKLANPSLRVTPDTWEVASGNVSDSRGVRLRGTWLSPAYERETWKVRDEHGAYITELMVGSGGVLAVRGRFDAGPSGPLASLAYLGGYRFVTELAAVTSGATTPIALTTAQIRCADPPAAVARLVCTGTGIDRDTRIWTVDPAVGDMTTIGAVGGYVHGIAHVSDREALLLAIGVGPVLVDVTDARAWALRPSDAPAAMSQAGSGVASQWLLRALPEGPVVQAGTVAGETVVLATTAGEGTRVAVYRVAAR